MKCSYCQKSIIRNLTMKEILWPFAIQEERCKHCDAQFLPITKPYCPTCLKGGTNQKCEECQRWQKLYPEYQFKHHAFFQYDEGFSQWISQYKFLGDYQLRQTFVPEIKQYFKKHAALVCPIPLSKERYAKRGFNQVEGFLAAAGIKTDILLAKKAETAPQSQKNRQERLASPQPFEVVVEKSRIEGKRIILVDDVYTTGRTLFHAAALLAEYQPQTIQTLSLAR